nr:tRNA pseudouridine(38-40) synthase TruA [Corynebacterium lactis]
MSRPTPGLQSENVALPGGLVRLRLDIAYDGTDFHGWASQRDKPTGEPVRTVQATLEQTLEKVLRHPVSLTVAGRTDAGVHASGQVAHVDVARSALDTRSIGGDPSRLVRRVARLLPDDVTLRAAEFAPDGFDARFSALRRHYVYRVTTAPSGALPTRSRDTAVWNRPVSLERLQSAADPLLGLNNFAAFCRFKPHATTIRDLQRFEWRDVSSESEPELYEAHVTADAFCWSMVRSLVGACLSVGEGRRPEGFTRQLLAETKRSPLVPVAEARGLSLVGVDYPGDGDLASRAEATRGLRSDIQVDCADCGGEGS